MTSSKPTIILIPGGQHRPSHYRLLLDHLEAEGFPTRSAQLPSVDSPHPEQNSVAGDATFIRENLLLPELDTAGNNVILVMHSYGGLPGGAAAKGLGPEDRGRGRPAIIGMIYMCAMIGIPGKPSLRSKDEIAPWFAHVGDTNQCIIPDPGPLLYHDVDDPDLVKEAVSNIGTHSWLSFATPSPDQAWLDRAFEGRLAYIKCHKDRALPLETQEKFLSNVGDTKWSVEDFKESGHSPFLSRRDEVVQLLQKYSEQWV